MRRHLCVFNGFLALVLLMGSAGCITGKKEYSSFRVHLESDPGSVDRASAITVYRSAPLLIGIDRETILDESYVRTAAVLEQPVGFAIEIQLNRRGSWILERTTVGYKGRHLAIFSHFGPSRWLAAPEITGRNSSGRLVFSPDATREEAERFVRGLNNTAHKIERKENWPFPGPLDK